MLKKVSLAFYIIENNLLFLLSQIQCEMKTWKLFILTFLLMVGCKPSSEPTLKESSALLALHPSFEKVYDLILPSIDSANQAIPATYEDGEKAAILFQHYSDSLLSDIITHRDAFYEYQLLKAALTNRIGNDAIDEESINQTVNYYDSIGDKPLLQAHAHSFKGRSANSQGHTTEAAREYLRGLEILESQGNLNIDYNHAFGLSYNRLGLLLYFCGDFDASIECLKMGAHYFENEHCYRIVHDNMISIGTEFFIKKAYDSAAYYYNQAADIEENVPSPDNMLSIDRRAAQAFILYKQGNRNEAYKVIYELKNNASSNADTIFFNYALGNFYYDDAQYDSALYYLESSFKYFPATEIEPYTKIITLCNKVGDTARARQYAQHFSSIREEEVNRINSKSETLNLYEQYKTSQHQMSVSRQNRKIIHFLILFSVLTLVVVASILYFERCSKKRQESHHEWYANMMQGRIKKSEAAARSKDEQIKNLQKQLEKTENVSFEPAASSTSFDDRMAQLMEKPICKEIMNKIGNATLKTTVSYPEFQLTEKQQVRLVKAVDDVFNRFSIEILNLYPRLTKSDILYCCLFLIGMNEKQIAALVGTTYQNVWSRSSKMSKIFNSNFEIKYILQGILAHWNY